jgi:hypothetical protein
VSHSQHRFGSADPQTLNHSQHRFGSADPQTLNHSQHRFGSADPQTLNHFQHRFGSADPFVTVSIYDPPPHGVIYSVLEDGIVESAQTAVRQRNLNPEWKENLSLTKFSLGSEVIIHVSDFDPSGFGSQMIGTLSFPVVDIMEAPQMNQVGFSVQYTSNVQALS